VKDGDRKKLRELILRRKASLDQLTSVLGDLSDDDLLLLAQLGNDVLDGSDLGPGTRSAVKALLAIGLTVALQEREGT